MFPRAPQNLAQERRGINAVASVAAALGQIWRETPTADVGIDGQLEFVDPNGFASGRTVAVQVKSGPSFLQNESETAYRFYPDPKHRAYWELYPLPVLLVLHDPDRGQSYWTDARQALRSPQIAGEAAIAVPKANVLESASTAQLFENVGVQADAFIDELEEVLVALIGWRSANASFPVSYFDLFTQGLTNICRSIYFGMDVACSAAEMNLALAGSEFGMGMSDEEHEFLFGFVKFLISQHLAHVDTRTALSTGSTGRCSRTL